VHVERLPPERVRVDPELRGPSARGIISAASTPRARAEGEAPDAVTREIGIRAGRRALLRLVGERYATS